MADLITRLQQQRRPVVVIVGLLVLALVLEVGFYLGQHTAFASMGVRPETYKAMQAELLTVQNTLRSRDSELAILRTRQEVDRQSLELVRREMAAQKEEIAGLEEGLGFYRSLISPGEIAPGSVTNEIVHHMDWLPTFVAAAAYNMAWGLLTALYPQWLFRLADMEPMRYPAVFACVGMIVGLYGVVYAEVARRPERGFVLAAVGLVAMAIGIAASGCGVQVHWSFFVTRRA